MMTENKQVDRDTGNISDPTQETAGSASGATEETQSTPDQSSGDVSSEKTAEGNDADACAGEDPQDLLEQKDKELAEKQDQLLRARAEYENYKKRMAREREDLLKFGNEQLLKELLPVLDNFERSLTHAKTAKNVDSLIEGVELIHKEFLHTLKKYGLQEISSKGEKFDPAMHEATAQVATNEHPEGTVVEEFQKGYYVHDRLLRPSMVAVAAALPEPEAGEEQ